MATSYFNISHSSIVFCNNYAHSRILDVPRYKNQDIHYIIQNSQVSFVNNTSEGPVMEIAGIVSLYTSSITFENNTSINTHQFHKYTLEIDSTSEDKWSTTNQYCAILLVSSSTVYFFNSQVQFINNSAQYYSGGITLIDGNLIFDNSTAIFMHNEGGDGGAMAFYGKSFIKEPNNTNCNNNYDGTECRSSNVTLIFLDNKAHKRGGALFVEDSDYNTAWHSDLYGYDVYCLHFYCQVTEQNSNDTTVHLFTKCCYTCRK